jgi:membrane protease YdiL (CAAX protease family)
MGIVLSVLLLSALSAGSLLAWSMALHAVLMRREPIFPQRESIVPPLPASALILGGLCLLGFVAAPIIEVVNGLRGVAIKTPDTPSLLAIQAQFGLTLAMTAALIACLAQGAGGLRGQGLFLRPLGPQLRDAVLGLHLAIGPVFLVLAASEAVGWRGSEPEHLLLRMLLEQGSALYWFWITLTAVVAAPLLEEMLFRVLLQGVLRDWLPAAATVGVSSIVFCLVHRFPDSLALLPLAVVLGAVHLRRRSYLSVVLIHAAFNAINLLLTALGSAEG